MTVINISSQFPIVEHYLSQILDSKCQLERQKFKKGVFVLGQILAIATSQYLEYEEKNVVTPFDTAKCKHLVSRPTIIPILRAGLALQEGISSILENCPIVYCNCPKGEDGNRYARLDSKDSIGLEAIICDPIIATGKSIISTFNELKEIQHPKKLFVLSIISTDYSISQIQSCLPKQTILITCSIDSFTPGIRGTRPGLGDVGDLLYGQKNKNEDKFNL